MYVHLACLIGRTPRFFPPEKRKKWKCLRNKILDQCRNIGLGGESDFQEIFFGFLSNVEIKFRNFPIALRLEFNMGSDKSNPLSIHC